MDSAAIVFVTLALGVIIGVAVTALFVLAQRQRRRTAAALETRLPAGIDAVLATLAEHAVVCDPSYNVIRASPGATSMGLVTSRGQLEARIQPIAKHAWESDAPVEMTLTVPRGPFGAAEVTFDLRATQLPPRFILILARDVTEAIRLEAVRRDFVANVSHELKTPIGAMSLLSEAITESADDVEQVRYFANRMQGETDRLARLTRELIELSRLQATDSLDEADEVEVSALLARTADGARVAAEAKSVSVHVKSEPGLAVWGDAELLDTAIRNLVVNAITYSPPESSVGIGARRVGDTVEISVTDKGLGIAEEDQGRIFERFYRVDAARARNTGGTGLGLAIVRHIVENHGGEISVWSKLGQGSTFTVRLPLASTRTPEDASTEPTRTGAIRVIPNEES